MRSVRLSAVVGGGTMCCYFMIRTDNDFIVDEFPKTLPVTLYRILPLCWISRMCGYLSEVEIPVPLRGLILGNYVRLTGCDLSEAKLSNVQDYKSLSDLFQRQLKWDSRSIDRYADLISPCDGKVLHVGEARNGIIEQVKGVRFSITGFLGKDFDFWESAIKDQKPKNTTKAQPKSLFYCTIYLAPGDYHRFHAPTDCELSYRRYFTGKLLSVSPRLAKIIPGLFSVNERVAYFGNWKHGFFTFTAVGATNVGNIRVFADTSLPQNKDGQKLDLIGRRKEGEALRTPKDQPVTWEKKLAPAIKLSRGQLFGKFNLGSTIVLIFEAPWEFKFNIKTGDTVRMGSPLGSAVVEEHLDK